MYRLVILALVSCSLIFQAVLSSYPYGTVSESDLECMSAYNGTLDNDYLIGEWRGVYKFGLMLSPMPTSQCPYLNFTKFTPEELVEYQKLYNDTELPYDVTDNPIKYYNGRSAYKAMVIGNKEVKYFVYHWGYLLHAYRRLNDNFMVYILCDMRSWEIILFSRGMELPSKETIEAVIDAGIPDVASRRLLKQPHCAPLANVPPMSHYSYKKDWVLPPKDWDNY